MIETASVLSLFFLYAVGMQYNDPDPWLWVIHYGLALANSILVLFKKRSRLLLAANIILAITLLGTTIFNQYRGQPQQIGEYYSEIGGCLIVLIWNFILYFNHHNRLSRTKTI